MYCIKTKAFVLLKILTDELELFCGVEISAKMSGLLWRYIFFAEPKNRLFVGKLFSIYYFDQQTSANDYWRQLFWKFWTKSIIENQSKLVLGKRIGANIMVVDIVLPWSSPQYITAQFSYIDIHSLKKWLHQKEVKQIIKVNTSEW